MTVCPQHTFHKCLFIFGDIWNWNCSCETHCVCKVSTKLFKHLDMTYVAPYNNAIQFNLHVAHVFLFLSVFFIFFFGSEMWEKHKIFFCKRLRQTDFDDDCKLILLTEKSESPNKRRKISLSFCRVYILFVSCILYIVYCILYLCDFVLRVFPHWFLRIFRGRRWVKTEVENAGAELP